MRSPAFYYAAFFATGLAAVSTGALVALHGAGVPLADADIGRLIAAQFSGQLIGSYFVGRQVASRLVFAAALTATAMAAQAALGHFALLLLFAMGLGLGLAMGCISTLVGLDSPETLRTRRLEILNVFWPLGAASGPWLIARTPGKHAYTVVFTTLSVLFFAIAAASVSQRSPKAIESSKQRQRGTPIPWLLSLGALLIVGIESGLANWLPTFQQRYLPASAFSLPLATLFWGSILVSRMIASQRSGQRSERAVFSAATLAGGIGSLVLVLLHTPWLIAVAVVGTAFVIGPVYPMLLTHSIKLPRRGLVFLCAALGSALFPWGIGRSATASHSLHAAMLLPVAACLVLSVLSASKDFPAADTAETPHA